MKAIVTVAGLDKKFGGPSRSVPALCSALAQTGASVDLITLAEPNGIQRDIVGDKVNLVAIPTHRSRYHPFSWRTLFRAALQRAGGRALHRVIYDVGLWLPSNHLAATYAHRANIPLVISPRGMLSVEARQVSRWKKALAWRIYQRRDLAVARALHATSKAEASDLRAFGLLQPIAIVPNGVELPSEQSEPAKTNGVRTALFLSRLHPIKGLRDLINAWEQLRPQGWEVVIAGPDENNHRGEMEELVASKNLHREFRFVGSVDDKDKMQLYRAAELFILPSHSESFGQSVAEALSAGVPVITTCATPWQQIETFRCGWWIDPGVEPLTVALREATKRSPADLQEMGQRGRKLIAECFTWKASAEKMMEVFRWLGEGDKKPDWLV